MMQKCIVFLPVYNGSKYIKETIESVIKQDYKDFELVITDDKSTDKSIEILEKYKSQYPDKITVITNQSNLGVGSTLYNSYKEYYCGAGYFAMIGHDDVWAPGFLSSQIEALNSKKALVAFSEVNYINGVGKTISNDNLFFHKKIEKMNSQQLFQQLISRNFLCAPSSVINLNLCDPEELIEFWGYNNDTLQDYEMWLNLSLRGKFIFNNQTSISYRIHESNLSDEAKNILFSKLEYYATLQRVFFSKGFWQFLKNCDNRYDFIDKVIDNLKINLAYSNPCKLLLLNLCSNLLNRGYEDALIKDTYYLLYMDCGVITKCLKEGRNLPSQISIVQCGEVKEKRIVDCLKKSSNIYYEVGVEKIKHFSMCIAQIDSMEYLINNESFFRNLVNNQVIIVGNKDELNEAKDKFTTLLLDEKTNEDRIVRTIFSFMEDNTHIYRNGFFDMITAYHVPDLKTSVVKIELNEEIVRRIEYIEYLPQNVNYISGGVDIEVANNSGTESLFESNQICNEELILKSNMQFDIRMRILINNKLYLCHDVTNSSEGLVLNYKPVSYFSNPTRSNQYTSFNISDILAQYYELVGSYHNLTNSTFYRWYNKIWKILCKFKMQKFALKTLRLCKKIYGKLFIG